MFERDEADFEIMHNEKRKTFSLYVGTWHNTGQSFADCLFYLSLSDGTDRPLFFKRLDEFNHLFINNKDEILADIEANGLNMINSVLNSNNIEEYLNEFEYSEREEGYLKENEEYVFNYDEADKELEEIYKKDIIDELKEAKDIKEAYVNLQQLKEKIKQDTFDNIFDYSEKIEYSNDEGCKVEN